jgi:hypothetical protein
MSSTRDISCAFSVLVASVSPGDFVDLFSKKDRQSGQSVEQ